MQMLAPGQGGLSQVSERLEHLFGQLLAKPWFPHLVNLCALLLLSASLAHWTWVLFAPKTTSAPVAASARTTAAPSVNLQTIIAAHIFGAAPIAAGNVEDIPLSSLNLVLTGLIAAGDHSVALIRVEGQPEAPFTIGDAIVNGAVLKAVYTDRAIIMRNGVAESLLLEGAAQPLPGTPARETRTAPARSQTNDGAPRAAAPQAPAVGPNDIRQQGPNNYLVSRQALTEQMRTPQQLLSQSLMVPQAGGGFAVREIQPGSVYEKLGLHVGDVVRSANGQPLNSVEDVMKIYQQSNNNSYINLEVLRNGRVENLQYTLQ